MVALRGGTGSCPSCPLYTSTACRTTRFSAQRFRRLCGRVSTISTMSPGFASFFSSWHMNFDVRRSVLPYNPCRTCHSTATTMLFCILLLTTTPVFSDFCAIALRLPLLSEHRLDPCEVAADRLDLLRHFQLSHRLLDPHPEQLIGELALL